MHIPEAREMPETDPSARAGNPFRDVCYDVSARFRSFADVTAYMDGLGMFRMELTLDRMSRALAFLGIKRLPCPVIQVVGTNGKGSVCAFLQSLASAHGFRAGVFTSPHFLSPAERIRMDGRPLPEHAWPDLAGRAVNAAPDLTYFELLAVMAVLAFQSAEPDLLIFEAGLGGRYDATSALPADMVCFTPIALDHQQILGESQAAIAADKADALRAGVFAAVSAPQLPEVEEILRSKAGSLNIPFHPCADPLPPGVLPGLAGPHQMYNARLALDAWRRICLRQGWPSPEKAVRQGLARAFLPGRMQDVPARNGYPPFLLDGAHNAHGMAALLHAARERNLVPGAVVFACLADKNPAALIPALRELAHGAPLLIPSLEHNPRALPGGELAQMAGPGALALPSPRAALEKARSLSPEQTVLVCGSLYLLADFFTLFPHALNENPSGHESIKRNEPWTN